MSISVGAIVSLAMNQIGRIFRCGCRAGWPRLRCAGHKNGLGVPNPYEGYPSTFGGHRAKRPSSSALRTLPQKEG